MIAESQYTHKIEICKNVSNTFMFNNNIPMEQVRNKPMHFSLIFKDIFHI